jgi:hypothetical protein
MAELFAMEPDTRVNDLRNWIKFRWAFVHIFWPTEAQIITIAGWFKVLCETVIEECDAEFIRHCEPSIMEID